MADAIKGEITNFAEKVCEWLSVAPAVTASQDEPAFFFKKRTFI